MLLSQRGCAGHASEPAVVLLSPFRGSLGPLQLGQVLFSPLKSGRHSRLIRHSKVKKIEFKKMSDI